jgi:hypothetical protein
LRSTNQNELTEYMMSPEQLALFLGLGRTHTYQLLKNKAIPSIPAACAESAERTRSGSWKLVWSAMSSHPEGQAVSRKYKYVPDYCVRALDECCVVGG